MFIHLDVILDNCDFQSKSSSLYGRVNKFQLIYYIIRILKIKAFRSQRVTTYVVF